MLKATLVKLLETTGGLGIVRHWHRRTPTILMFHRIIKDPMIPGIDPDTFSQQLRYLKKYYHVMNMQQFFAAYSDLSYPDNSVVLTFDDGHADFYTHAWPRLRAEGLTATLFVTTDFIDGKLWLWPDLLRYVLLNTPLDSIELPTIGKLQLQPDNLLVEWNRLGDYCLSLSNETRTAFLEDLVEKLEVRLSGAAQAPFNAVTWDQLREMSQQGLDIGSHTLSHPILSSLSEAQLQCELADSKHKIATEIGIAPTGICYPNGMAKDVSALTEKIAAQHYRYGVVAYPASLDASHPMHWGRLGSSNNIVNFKLKLSKLMRLQKSRGEYK